MIKNISTKLKIKSKKDLFPKFLFLCYCIFSIYLVFINFSNKTTNTQTKAIIFVLLIFGISAIFFYRRKKENKDFNKYLFLILLIIPIIIRLSLVFLKYGNFMNDYEYLYNNALKFAQGTALDGNYISLFPYIYPFIVCVGLVFKIFGSKYTVFILLNIIVELIGALFFYLTMKNFSNKKTAQKAILLYLYNPLNILWITKCCPVIFVNTFLILTIYLFSKIDFKNKYIIMSIITGIFIGLTNAFRPVMIIFIIALLIFYLYQILDNFKENAKKSLISFILIVASFAAVNKVILISTAKSVGVHFDKAQSGFTLLVGSNMESHGLWNMSDATLFSELVDEYGNIEGPRKAQEIAIERYKSYGLDNIKLLKYKSHVLGTNIDDYTYQDVLSSIMTKLPNSLKKITELYVSIFFYSLLFLNLVVAFKLLFQNYSINKLTLQSIFGMGLFLAMLFVEVSARYFIPIFIPLLFTCSIIFVNNKETDE